MLDLCQWCPSWPLASFLVIFGYGVHRYLLDKRYRLPPGPMPLPYIGNFAVLADPKKKLWKVMRDVSKKHGDGKICTLYFGQFRMILLNDADLIHDALVNQSKIFSWRQDTYMPGCHRVPVGIIVANYDQWQQRRRFALKAMRDFGMGKDLMTHRIQDEAGFLLSELEKHKDQPFNPKKLFTNSVSNIICQLVFGKRFDYGDQALANIHQRLDALITQNPAANAAFLLFPCLEYFAEQASAQIFINIHSLVTDMVTKAIEEHRTDFNRDHIRDFPDLFIQSELTDEGLDMKTFGGVMGDLFIAGGESTATALTWTLLYLANNPEIQERCHNAIDSVIDTDRLPSPSDRPKLVYIEAMINEVFRHASVLPVALFHSNLETGAKLGGYDIPPFTVVMYNVAALHHDEAYWKDPEAFRPERFLSEDGSKLVSHSSHFMPFGLGPRTCIGESLARMEFFIFVVSILHRYRFKLHAPVDLDAGLPGLINNAPAFEIIASSR